MRVFKFLAVAGLFALAACSGDELTRTFGLTRDAPDEFQVTTRAPLSMPPDFNLRPPRPGARSRRSGLERVLDVLGRLLDLRALLVDLALGLQLA